jgi:hypothetical protein
MKNQQILVHQLLIQFINHVWYLLHVSALHCNSQGAFLPIHNILSTALQLSISQKALGTLPEDGNDVTPKHVGGTMHN